MRIRMVLAAVFAAVLLSPAAASASVPPGGGGAVDVWTGHSSCGTVAFDGISFYQDYGGAERLFMSGTITNCPSVKRGDFFVPAVYQEGTAEAVAKALYYYQGPATYFEGSVPVADGTAVCLASFYDERMACLSVTASGSTWTVTFLSTDDPSVDVPVTFSDLIPADPQCATCWGN